MATVLVNLGANDEAVVNAAKRRGVDDGVTMEAYDRMPVFSNEMGYEDIAEGRR